MLVACWSVKGGSGTTVVAAALALLLARRPGGCLLADLAGDLPAALGLPDPEPGSPGVAEWMSAGADADALRRIEIEAAAGLALLPRGRAPWPRRDGDAPPAPPASGDGDRLVAALAGDVPHGVEGGRPVVADCGTPEGPAAEVAAAATLSLLVIRPCYLALRRAVNAPVRPSGIVLVEEKGRSLGPHDVEDVLGVPVRVVVPWDPSIARAVDAGLLSARVPRTLTGALRRAAA